MFKPETPITDHPTLPESVPLVADFHDDRNRLSYYHPKLCECDNVEVPITRYFAIEGDFDSIVSCEYRDITKFLQDIPTQKGFIRGDFSSAKLSREGRILESHDPQDIKRTFAKLVENHIITERHLGKRIAVRQHIPHDTEIRYFIRNGDVVYQSDIDKPNTAPKRQIQTIADKFNNFAWSVDFIQHSKTKDWYCIDMGLDGLYPDRTGWTAISEHTDKSHSPEQHIDKMPNPDRFSYIN